MISVVVAFDDVDDMNAERPARKERREVVGLAEKESIVSRGGNENCMLGNNTAKSHEGC